MRRLRPDQPLPQQRDLGDRACPDLSPPDVAPVDSSSGSRSSPASPTRFVAIPSQTQLQEDLPEEVRGRVFGVLNMLVSVASFLPILIVGPIAGLDRHDGRLPARRAARRRLRRRLDPHPRAAAPGGDARSGPTSARTATRSRPRWAPRCPRARTTSTTTTRTAPMARPDRPGRRDRRGRRVRSRPTARSSPRRPRPASRSRPAIRPRPTATTADPLARAADRVPRVAVVFTGGTISMRHDPRRRRQRPGARPARRSSRQVPGLDEIADVVPIDRGLTPASHFTFPALFEICGPRSEDVARGPDDRRRRSSSRAPTRSRRPRSSSTCSTPAPKPVVVTGAMRVGERSPTTTGRRNLPTRSVVAAVAPELRGADVGRSSCSTGSIEPADDVTKTHALRVRHVPEPEQRVRSAASTADRGRPRASPRAAPPRGRDARRGARLPRHGDGGDGRDADRRAARGGRGRLRRRGDRRGQHGRRRCSRPRSGRWPTGCRSRSTTRSPGRRRVGRLRVPRRRRDVGAGRGDARRPPRRAEGADRARARPRRGPGSRRPRRAARRSGADPRPDRSADRASEAADAARRSSSPVAGSRRSRAIAGFGWVEAVGISRRPRRVRRLGGRARDAGRPAHPPDRARPRRGRDPGPDRRAPPPRRGRHRAATRSTCRRRRRSRTASPRSRAGARPAADRDALARGPRLGHRPLGRLADRRRPRARSRPAGASRSGPTTTTRSGRAARRSAIAGDRRATPPIPTAASSAATTTASRPASSTRSAARLVIDHVPPRDRRALRDVDRAARRATSSGWASSRSTIRAALSLQEGLGPGSPRTGRSTSAATLPHPRPRLRSARSSSRRRSRRGCAAATRSGRPAGRARFGWLKLFADGTLASRTAALLEPIEAEEGRPLPAGTERGICSRRRSGSRRSRRQAADAGIATHVHAIGDRGVPGRRSTPSSRPPARCRSCPASSTSSCSIPDDRGRFGRAGIAASIQPIHSAPTPRPRDGCGATGPRRTATRWRSLAGHRRGARVRDGRAGRADRPVARPVDGGHPPSTARGRADSAPFGPDEALTLEQALRAACVGPAVDRRRAGPRPARPGPAGRPRRPPDRGADRARSSRAARSRRPDRGSSSSTARSRSSARRRAAGAAAAGRRCRACPARGARRRRGR